MRILVTGGAGFIGSHVVDRLVAEGRDVVVLDNLDPQVHGPAATKPLNIEGHVAAGVVRFLHGDVRDPAAVATALDGVEAVIHLAAAVGVGQSMYQPHYYTSVNVDGQGVLLEAMAQAPARYRRLVVASSMSIYGEGAYRCPEHGDVRVGQRSAAHLAAGDWESHCPHCAAPLEPVPTPETKPLESTSIYAITKKTQEELALCFGAAYGIPTAALRFFNVYGSRQALSNPYTGVAAIFLARLKNGQPPLVFEDGRQSRDFVHVHDVAAAVVAPLRKDYDGCDAFNVCTGRPISIGGVAATLAALLASDVRPEIVARFRKGDIRHCIGDPAKARERLGFEAGRTLEQGFRELVAWSEQAAAEDRVGESLRELEQQGLLR